MTANSTRKLATPNDALAKLMECLVLGFVYSESSREFCLVCDYPKKEPGSDRAFAAFVFEGVADFVREKGNLAKFSRFVHAYHLDDDDAPVVIQALRTTKRDGLKALVEFWFGPNFGGVTFGYDEVAAWLRDSKAQRVGETFVYRDNLSGEEFPFETPFPEIMRPGSP